MGVIRWKNCESNRPHTNLKTSIKSYESHQRTYRRLDGNTYHFMVLRARKGHNSKGVFLQKKKRSSRSLQGVLSVIIE